jgi:hypothetical protein
VSTRVAQLEDHEPDVNAFGDCRLCWLPVDGHDEALAELRAKVEEALTSSAVTEAFHHGPGPHPSGSPQQVHGAKRGGRLMAQALKSGGFTYQPVALNGPKEGFAVSPYPERTKVTPVGEMSAKVINDYAKANREFIEADPSRHLGGWNDKDTGLFYLDVVVVKASAPEAAKVAREFGEIAFYDLSTPPGQDGTIRTEDFDE